MQKYAFVLGISVFAAPLFGQSVQRVQPDPDATMFHFYFRQVLSADSAAQALRTKGRSDAIVNVKLKEGASLTDAELNSVKQAAADCIAKIEDHAKKAAAEIEKMPRPSKVQPDPSPSVAARLNALQNQKDQIIQGCVNQLRTGIGTAKFQQLDASVRQTTGSKIKTIDLVHVEKGQTR